MSSPREASPCDAVIVQAAATPPDAVKHGPPEHGPPEHGPPEHGPLEHDPPGGAGPCHGTLCSDSRLHGGPLRLPRRHQAEFVQQFNQLYRSLGMRLEVLQDLQDLQDLPAEP